MLAAAIFCHFSFVVLSLLPLNPLSYALGDVLAAYVLPFFAQNWKLFAPEPVSSDSAAYARAIYHERGEERTTPWIDFTDPVLDAVRRNPVSPLNFRLTVMSKAMAGVFGEAGLAAADAVQREKLMDEWVDPVRMPRGLVVLEAAGSAVLRAAYPGIAFEHVQVMMSSHPVPRFSKRYDSQVKQPTDYFVFRPSAFPTVVSWAASGAGVTDAK